MVLLNNDWDEILKDDFASPAYQNIRQFLAKEYRSCTVYPDMHDIFNALKLTSYKDVKVVILGQDPYHGQGQAHGLCFSVQKGIDPPPSLKNIYKEIYTDTGTVCDNTAGDLTSWAKQGVLLLNATLTVRAGQPASHANIGWQGFTDGIIKKINEKSDPVVFILWGGYARSKKALITNPKHLIIESAHPSPLSAYNGFFGSKPFSKTNAFLVKNGMTPINFIV